MLKWYKYRQKFSSGPGDWEYGEWETKEWLEQILNHEYFDLEGYRGCDIEEIELPPIEVLELEMANITLQVNEFRKKFERYKELLNARFNLNKSLESSPIFAPGTK